MKTSLQIIVIATLVALSALVSGFFAQSLPKGPSPQLKNAIGMEFVTVSPGEFMMGCSNGDADCKPDENPRHRVQITKSFEIGKYEVTQAQWVALMQTNPSGGKGDSRPVDTVSKIEAQDFIAKLNARNDGYRYRLPTEAEWEYTARAGTGSSYAGPLGEVAWYADNSEDESHPVGEKKPNAWGLYDITGNVREWVSDFYSDSYYSVSPTVDPTGPQPCIAGGNGIVAANLGNPGVPVPGGPGFGRGGRGGNGGQVGLGAGRGGPGGPQTGSNPPVFPAGGTQQEQIDALRRQVEQLQQQLQDLRFQFEAGPPRGGCGGFGGPGLPGGAPGELGGPIACIGQGIVDGGAVQLVDTLDGLPTGLPVVRGGGWDQSGVFLRVSARYTYYGPTLRVSDIGFRVVREQIAQ